jgi:SAM-dependent methyltransferase
MATREQAMSYPRGEIELGFCQACGFISNVAFDPARHEYSSRYEETQGFSPTFNAFHQSLARRLIERYDLHDKNILEVGCGKGEFLTLLCELGANRGVGFDPAYVNGRSNSQALDRVTFIKDFYSERYAHYRADFVCCKMTLEHIHCTAQFVSTIRRAIGKEPDTVVFFQVPEVTRILRELAFWDIYYEHCSYFSAGSLCRLFRNCGFEFSDVIRDYDNQYLMIEAKPSNGKARPISPVEDDMQELARDVAYFSKNCQHMLDKWKDILEKLRQSRRRTVLWGGGSKGVAFLTTLGGVNEIDYVVDINPFKHGTYMPGTGQKIVPPAYLKEYRPDVVIVMNPIYRDEIRSDLEKMNVAAEVITV